MEDTRNRGSNQSFLGGSVSEYLLPLPLRRWEVWTQMDGGHVHQELGPFLDRKQEQLLLLLALF